MSRSPSRTPNHRNNEDEEERRRVLGDGPVPDYDALLREALRRIEDSEQQTAENEKRIEVLCAENAELRSRIAAGQQTLSWTPPSNPHPFVATYYTPQEVVQTSPTHRQPSATIRARPTALPQHQNYMYSPIHLTPSMSPYGATVQRPPGMPTPPRAPLTQQPVRPDRQGNLNTLPLAAPFPPIGQPIDEHHFENRIAEAMTKMQRDILKSLGRPTGSDELIATSQNTPLQQHILETIPPNKFNVPTLPKYDGNSDPHDHICQYKQVLLGCSIPSSMMDGMMCKLFSQSLKGTVLQ